MDILILNWRDVGHPKSGGAELVTMEHAKGWVRAGHGVTWLTSAYKGAKDEEAVEGVRLIRKLGTLTIFLYVPLYLLLYGRRYDIVVDEVHGFPFFSVLFTKLPVVVFIHEIAGDIWDYMFSFPKNKIGKMLERLCFRLYKSCLFWTVAPSTVDELVLWGIPRGQCRTIISPIIAPKAGTVTGKTKQLKPTYLFVSRVVRMKGIEEVIKAFSFIYREQKNAALWIVGSGEQKYMQEPQAMIEEYGVAKSVTFYGKVSEKDKFDLMARSHILLHASVKEGWGLVVSEAAFVGTPAVVYNAAGLKDAVINDKTGVVLQNNSPQEMAVEALRLFSDKKRYTFFQKNGISRVRSLTWPNAIKSSLEVLSAAQKKDR